MAGPVTAAEPPLASTAHQALSQLQALAGSPALNSLTASQLMGERALLSGLTYAHARSAGGSCRLLATADNAIAISLPRPSDWELVAAWLETSRPINACWTHLAAAVANRRAGELVHRARLLGLAAAATGRAPRAMRTWELPQLATAAGNRSGRAPLVLDLSALWAGPLCAHLLDLCGADVVKIESTTRPDGARYGEPTFYSLLNQNKPSVALDLTQHDGRRTLRGLIDRADIVVEAARPRALQQMGIQAERWVATKPGLTWVSITGHGRDAPSDAWVAFGDDAGVAAGLSDVMQRATGNGQFAGDAIADPMTGIQAALSAWRSWLAGGSRLISVPLVHVAAANLEDAVAQRGRAGVIRTFAAWWQQATSSVPHGNTRRRQPKSAAHALGADTHTVLSTLGLTC